MSDVEKSRNEITFEVLQVLKGQKTTVSLDALLAVMILITRGAKVKDIEVIETITKAYLEAPPVPGGIVTFCADEASRPATRTTS